MFHRNLNNVNLNDKVKNEIEYEYNLIKKKQQKLYKQYTTTNEVSKQDNDYAIYIVLKNVCIPNADIITIINDIDQTFLSSLTYFLRQWNKNAFSDNCFDKIDLFVASKLYEDESQIVMQLKEKTFDNLNDDQIHKEIADLIMEYVSYVDASGKAYIISDTQKYSWGQYVNGQLYSFKYLKERVKMFLKNPKFEYTRFNEYDEDPKQLLEMVTQKELLKKNYCKREMNKDIDPDIFNKDQQSTAKTAAEDNTQNEEQESNLI